VSFSKSSLSSRLHPLNAHFNFRKEPKSFEKNPANAGLHNRPFGHNLLGRERLLSWRRDQLLGGRQVRPFPSHNFT